MEVMGNGKIIALYLRISKRDEEVPAELESNSIGNQRGILYEYVEKHIKQTGFEIHEFVDDGYSGTSMNRPAMQELLSLAQKGRIYAILVKDLSRFARNYIEVGNYMEKIFPYIGVRFISVNDQYDSERMNNRMPGIDIAFKGIIHDYYCKELSRKLKTVRKMQVSRGRSIMSKPPYGYWKSDQEKGVLVVDRQAAQTVEMIFNEYLEGMSAYKIAQQLNQRGIDSPNRRLERAGMVHFKKEFAEKLCWNTGTVLSILKNRVYIGDAVGNKSERIKISVNRCRKLEESQWIVVENRHEPIIDREVFERVQKRLAENSHPRRENRKTHSENTQSLFQGILICGTCRSVMVKSGENKGIDYYSCIKCRMTGKKTANIQSDFLKQKILAELPERFRQAWKKEAKVKMGLKVGMKQEEMRCAKKRQKQEMTQQMLQLYENYAEGRITRQDYVERRAVLLAEPRKVPEREDDVETEIKQEEDCIKMENPQVDCRMIQRCIRKIVVEDNRQIRILWKGREGDKKLLSPS